MEPLDEHFLGISPEQLGLSCTQFFTLFPWEEPLPDPAQTSADEFFAFLQDEPAR